MKKIIVSIIVVLSIIGSAIYACPIIERTVANKVLNEAFKEVVAEEEEIEDIIFDEESGAYVTIFNIDGNRYVTKNYVNYEDL